MFFFFKRETAYEMRISDWVQTCALPILLCSAGFTFALFLAAPAFAQDSVAASSDDDVHSGGPIVVTAPYVRSLDILGNVSVLEGDELARDIRGQIGDTLTRQPGVRSEERRVGKECVSKCRSRWQPYH